MAKRNADLRRQRALDRLVGRLGDSLERGHRPTFGQRMEYNSLKRKLGQEGNLI